MDVAATTTSSPLSTSQGQRVAGVTSKSGLSSDEELTDQEKSQLRELKARDREVRAHEQAHIAAGGRYVRGGASYTFQRGPDGKQYAIGGEVKIDVSKKRDPEATLEKAQQIQRAALAPAQPSTTDRAIAAKAAQMAVEARAEIAQEKREESQQETNTPFSSIFPPNVSGQLLDLTA
jgi:hypothetical protein